MAEKLSRGTRIYIRRRKAELRRTSDNPSAAIDALMRQFAQPAKPDGASGKTEAPRG